MSNMNDFIEATTEFLKQTLRILLLGEEPDPPSEEQNQSNQKPSE